MSLECYCGAHRLYRRSKAAELYYLQQALVPTVQDQLDRIVLSRLPKQVIDAHVHTTTELALKSRDEQMTKRMMSTFPVFDIEASAALDSVLWPDLQTAKLRIPTPYFGIDFRAANAYLANSCPSGDRWTLLGSAAHPLITLDEMAKYINAHSALKMYPFAEGVQGRKIVDVFPLIILEACDAKSIPIILHLPDALSKLAPELLSLMRNFPHLPVVLAHIGLINEQPPQERQREYDALRSLAKNELLFVDTAMVLDWEIILFALRTLGYDRVLFGSDEPICAVRALPFNHPVLGPWLSPGFPYHWMAQDRLVCEVALETAPLIHWSCIRAAVLACDGYTKAGSGVIEAMFSLNAKRLFFDL